MGRTERLFRLVGLLRKAKRMQFNEMRERMNVSPATLKRDLKYLRETLGTPVHYDAFDRTYRVSDPSNQPHHEIPSVWFSEAELYSLHLAQQLLKEIDPQEQLAPNLKSVVLRIEALLAPSGRANALVSRIKFRLPGKHSVDATGFTAVTTALVRRIRLSIRYFTSSRPALTSSVVSPQRLVFLQEWHLDAWCHNAQAMRRFNLHELESAVCMDEAALEVSPQDLDDV
jgi:predicted DNA-binding transcriptional regulator YafY